MGQCGWPGGQYAKWNKVQKDDECIISTYVRYLKELNS